MLTKIEVVVVLCIVTVLLVLCWGRVRSDSNPENTNELVIGSSLAVPNGYTLIAASEYGRFFGVSTFYVQQNVSGRIYVLKNGQIGAEVVLPHGYTLAGVSAYGEHYAIRTFYCRNITTDETFECKPK